MTLWSPTGNKLEKLDGTPTNIQTYGEQLKTAASTMEETSKQLKLISEGKRQIAESVDAVREAAGETYPELDKAKIRYRKTGQALTDYASALETAHSNMQPYFASIPEKNEAVNDARIAESDADNAVRLQVADMQWGVEVSVAEQNRVQEALTTARSTTETAEGELESLWGEFDRVFSTWSDAYDKAVSDIDTAFVEAGNNDVWGEDLLAFLGWVAVGLAVVALFVTGPIALAIAAIGALVGLAMLAITALKFTKGRGNWWELGISIIGVIPFARPLASGLKGLRGGFSSVANAFKTGRGAVRQSVRSTFPRHSYSSYSGGLISRTGTFARNTGARAANAYYATRSAFRSTMLLGRFRIGDFFVSRPAMNAWGGGHNSVTSLANFLTKQKPSFIGEGAMQWVSTAASYAPSAGSVIANRVESVLSMATLSDFLGEQLSDNYRAFRGRFAQ